MANNSLEIHALVETLPVETLANIASVLNAIREIESNPPRIPGSSEWGIFLLLGQCVDALHFLSEQLADKATAS